MEKSTDKNSSNGSLSRHMGSAAAGVHEAVNSAAESARPTADRLRDSANQATDKLYSGATRAAEVIEAQSKKLKDGQVRFSESCRTHLREKPMASLGMAVAAGFVLALLFKRK
jgi:ElaB/YqjD/DUF883 family membrane-anchored ribosome-binding protein